MNLKELDSFRISDAISFHDKLNPKLWNNTRLRPEVKQQLLIIAEDFLEELGINGLDVADMTVSGSNAAFSYTPNSDLDLHILVDMSKLPNDEVYRELFTAKKSLYNDSHDIKIHGIPVELYVQDAREPVVSLGEYSLKNDNWLKIPSKRRANFDQTATKTKYEKLLTLIELALKSRKYSKVSNIVKTIKRYRQSGLDKGGEFGPENLAYKALRAQGYITKLYDLRDKLHSEKLTIETMYQPINDDYDSNDPTYSVNEFSTMRFAAEKTPAINPYGGRKDIQYRGSMSEASDKKISFKIQKGNGKFSTTLTVNNSPAGIYQYDSNTGRSIAEVYPEFKGKGLGKLLVLHAIYTAAQLGLDFQEDESRTSAYDNVLDSLSSNGYIVDDDGYWYVTGEGEQYLKQSLNEASGYIPSEKEKNDPRFSTALTVDVHPDSIKKNAKAFGWLTSRAGIPPTAKANGKF
jgi:hypothetical protein